MSDKRWTKWSQWEERSLRELYDPFWITRATIAERIGRSPRAVKDKIRREGLKKLQWRLWTEEEKKKLLALGNRYRPRTAYTEAFPGRTYDAIKIKLYKLQKQERQNAAKAP